MDAHKIVEEDIQTYIRKAMKAGILVNPRISGVFSKNQLLYLANILVSMMKLIIWSNTPISMKMESIL